MKIQVIKHHGGALVPASEIDAESMTKIKTGGQYEIQINRTRNPKFHRKVFAFFNFCFEHWHGGNENLTHKSQFDVFRSHLTVLAGYYDQFSDIHGNVRVEAKSISYGSMSQDDFENFYVALTNAAMKHIFHGCGDEMYDRLISFF